MTTCYCKKETFANAHLITAALRSLQRGVKEMKKVWLKAICPICGKQYEYLSDYKPKTCGNCLQKFQKGGK